MLVQMKAVVGRIENGTMNAASDLGERLGVDLLTYNPLRMRYYHRRAVENAPGVIASLRARFPEAHRVADVGSGSGAFVAEAVRQGWIAVGCERSRTGRALGRRQGARCVPFDLTDEPPAVLPWSPDLAYSFEVAEHLPPELGDRLVRFLAALAPTVVFSAAHPGQGGTGHINEQPREYWAERFEQQGMRPDRDAEDALRTAFAADDAVAPWFDANVQVLRRSGDEPDRAPDRPRGGA
jgi:SAM-dependent methyltransferase